MDKIKIIATKLLRDFKTFAPWAPEEKSPESAKYLKELEKIVNSL